MEPSSFLMIFISKKGIAVITSSTYTYNRFEKLANNLTIKLQNESIISEEMGKNLRSYNSVAPKLYGLRKTHKKECALRPVVYVDDVITAIPKDRMDQTLKTFNSVNNRIQFTMEVENNGTLPFLDMNIIRNEDGSIVTNWYVKPISSGRCINYNSNHPMSQKIGIIKGLLFRALKLSNKKFHIENKKRIELILKNNNYPTSLIHMVFNKFKIERDQKKVKELNNKRIIKFPFIKPLSNKIKKCFKNTNVKLVFYNLVKINSIYTKLKDRVDKLEQSNLVYKIPCVCDKCYIGQTKQKLKKRLEQHKNDCKPMNAQKSNITALAEHHFSTGHNFKFDETNILDKGDNWYKRNISEMYHITNNNTVNYRTDTNNLNNIYNEILKFNYHNKTH
ncbi:hypothetical protein M0804_013447 [Polistes exclamans]|nr:hypothetical protein M0804_013447 [Polistes exclamans]